MSCIYPDIAPPYLVIRPAISCWVETLPINQWSVTLQALNEGCLADAWLYDSAGNLWPILKVEFNRSLTIWDKLMPWRQFPIICIFGTVQAVKIQDILEDLAAILTVSNQFSESLESDPTVILDSLCQARTPLQLIKIAKEYL